jgi:cytochrome b561
MKNTPENFGTVAKAFHWAMALMIIGLLVMGFVMAEMVPSPTKFKLYTLHKSIGLVVFCLAIFRLIWRLSNVVPRIPDSLGLAHRFLMKGSPVVLYSLMILMPVSGLIMSDAGGHPITFFDLYTLPSFFTKNPDLSKAAQLVHHYTAWAFIGILVAHTGAALYHRFILKNTILQRMLPNWFWARK